MIEKVKDILIFLGGGCLFYIIYVVANKLKNPGLAAIFSLLPISLICCYFISENKILSNYFLSLMLVYMISILVCLLGFLVVKKTKISGIYFVSLMIIFWLILQLLLYYGITHKLKLK